jgi:farnesyl-diphosphate farnesyltransferase
MAYASHEILSSLLRDVSRSFYLTLRVLPGSIRRQISLAYLLARTTDTVADTELVPLAQRLASLQALREQIEGTSNGPLHLGEFARHQGSPAERALVEKSNQALALLNELSPQDRPLVIAVLRTIIGGQELDLRRFANGSVSNIFSLQNAEELDDYTYRVAGCVGEFWTKICRAHVFPGAKLDDQWLLANGIRFGKGLQLINILRDIPNDLRIGRCYLPTSQLQSVGLTGADLVKPEVEPRLRPVYNSWLGTAEGHLAAGWEYTKALPRRNMRVRLACAWPLLIGGHTLAMLKTGNILDPAKRIKISRPDVRRIMWRSLWYYPRPDKWNSLYQLSCNNH